MSFPALRTIPSKSENILQFFFKIINKITLNKLNDVVDDEYERVVPVLFL